MKSKEYIVLGIVILLLGAYLLLRSGDQTQYELPVLPEADAGEITRIEIAPAGDTIDLVREGDDWFLGESRYPADASTVSDILSVLETLTLTALVSESGAYARYDLTPETAIRVRAWVGDRLVRELAVGKAAGTYQHTFVRIGENPDVYHARDSFRRSFDVTADDLRDKSALSFDVSEITAIDIAAGQQAIALSLEEGPVDASDTGETDTEGGAGTEAVWKGPGGESPDADAVQRLLSQLAYLSCSGYLEGTNKAAFSAPTCTITLEGKERYTLSLFETEGDSADCPAISSQNDYPFTLGETACSRLRESLEKLLGSETSS